MEHVVFYTDQNGAQCFAREADLAAAVAFVEQLRNMSGITEFEVNSMTQVPVSFRTYYVASVPEAQTAEVPAEPAAEPPADAPALELAAQPEPPTLSVVPEPAPDTDVFVTVATAPAQPSWGGAASEAPVLPEAEAKHHRSLGFFSR